MNRQENDSQTALNGSQISFMGDQPGKDGGNPQLPDWVELIPAGRVQGRDGRYWENSDPAAIIARFLNSGVDLPIDLEHATELKAPKGEPAPASGWIKALENRQGTIWGKVEWNASGKDLVGSKQYRYLSPVILYVKESGEIAGLTSVGLTNRPNLTLQALNQQQGESSPQGQDPKENSMNLKALLAAMGLPETATETEALNAIQKMKSDLASANNSMAASTDLAKFVPRGDYDAVLARATNAETVLADQKKSALETAINSEIALALTAGKIIPATVDYHKAQCQQEGGLDRFKAYVAATPAIAAPSGLDGKEPEGQGKALNAEEAQIAAMFGNTVEDIKKYQGI
ncbi:MAG: phage protease [Deltaproteobacteria bacterium]|nr:phage protease [Deltaproteobacteria bacterium]